MRERKAESERGRERERRKVGEVGVLESMEAAVVWARELGYARVVTVGFSLGGAVVLREGALMAEGPGRVDAVVSVSAPAFWYYRGTRIMRVAHWMVETRPGRLVMRASGTRITSIRNKAEFGSSLGGAATQPGSSSAGRTGAEPET